MLRKGSTSPSGQFTGSEHQHPGMDDRALRLILDSSKRKSSSVESLSFPMNPDIRWSNSVIAIEATADVNMITDGATPGSSRAYPSRLSRSYSSGLYFCFTSAVITSPVMVPLQNKHGEFGT